MRIVRAFRRLPSSAPSRPSLGGVRRTLTRRPVPASRAERPLGDRTGNRGRNAGQTGKMRRKTDARQVGAGLIIATHQPDQLLGPEGPRSQAHFVDRGRNEPGHTETNVYRSSCGGSQKRGATMANVRGSCPVRRRQVRDYRATDAGVELPLLEMSKAARRRISAPAARRSSTNRATPSLVSRWAYSTTTRTCGRRSTALSQAKRRGSTSPILFLNFRSYQTPTKNCGR